MKNEFLQYVLDMTSLGWTITFSHQPFNLTIKVKKDELEHESWLPYSDHCDEKTITRAIVFMIDKLLMEPKDNPGLP
jgi:hypothetical protein